MQPQAYNCPSDEGRGERKKRKKRLSSKTFNRYTKMYITSKFRMVVKYKSIAHSSLLIIWATYKKLVFNVFSIDFFLWEMCGGNVFPSCCLKSFKSLSNFSEMDLKCIIIIIHPNQSYDYFISCCTTVLFPFRFKASRRTRYSWFKLFRCFSTFAFISMTGSIARSVLK